MRVATCKAMFLTMLVAVTIACRFEAVDAFYKAEYDLGGAHANALLPARQRSILATSKVQEGDIICPDHVTPARLCVDIPKGLTNTCASTLCAPGHICKMVSCPSTTGQGTECIAVCVQKVFKPTGECSAAYPEVQCIEPAVCNLLCVTGKKCSNNKCGNCTAMCIDEFQCVTGAPVPCLLDPCQNKTCSAGRMCVSEYCGGCNAGCVLDQPCPNGNTRHACLGTANQCMVARCGFESTCVPDQCNNCAAVCVPPCPAGQYVNEDTASCRRCPAGHYCPGRTGTTAPMPCNSGAYADRPGLKQCKTCPAGTTTPGKPKDKGYRKCRPGP